MKTKNIVYIKKLAIKCISKKIILKKILLINELTKCMIMKEMEESREYIHP